MSIDWRGRRQQHGVAGHGQPRRPRRPPDPSLQSSVPATSRPGHPARVAPAPAAITARSAPSSTDAAQPRRRPRRPARSTSASAPLNRPPGDPHHRRVGSQRGRGAACGLRRLGVVDVVHPADAGHQARSGAARAGTPASPAAIAPGGTPYARASAAAASALATLCGAGGADVGDAAPARPGRSGRRPGRPGIAADHAELAGPGRAEPERPPRCAAPGAAAASAQRPRVVGVADRDRARRVDPALGRARRPRCRRASRGGARRGSAPRRRAAAATELQCSWKLDSSTASDLVRLRLGDRLDQRERRRCPPRRCACPAAPSMAASIRTVVVLPLVPVTASQAGGRRPAPGAAARPARRRRSPGRPRPRPRRAAACPAASRAR